MRQYFASRMNHFVCALALAVAALAASVTLPSRAGAQLSPARSALGQRALGAPESSFVVLKDRTRLFTKVEFGQPDKGVFVLVNGLIWGVDKWDALAAELRAQGHTVIRYSFRLQPESLRFLRRGEEPRALRTGTDVAEMADDLAQLLQLVGVRKPVQLVGLSYGATVAAELARKYPRAVENTIFLSPLVVPLDFYDAQGSMLRTWLASVRFWENLSCDVYGGWNPWLCRNRDFWYNSFYDYIYSNFLDSRVQKVPDGLDPALYKKSVFHLVRAVRDFDLKTYANSLPRVHLVMASLDEKNLLRDQARFWELLPREQKKSLALFKGADHRIPESAPVRTAAWLDMIAKRHPDLQNGRRFDIQADR